jgi:Fe-S cluster biogenesis protein NfuA/nitrite reductase/ring-hydroxylating ferredoxin subunit
MTQTLNPPATSESVDQLDQLAAKVDAAIAAVQALDEASRTKALDLKQAVEQFHKTALTTVVRRLKSDPRGKELLFELIDDPLVFALLSMHGIVRADITTRVSRVIDAVRPYMRSHGGDVELVEVRERVAYVRLHGACNGCSMSAVTLRDGVEEALRNNVPEITRVEVVPNEPGPALIMPDMIQVRDSLTGWVGGPQIEDVPPGTMHCFDCELASILIVNLDNRLTAYRNACSHQGLPLDGGLFDAESGTITCPWHGFCYDGMSGECLTAPHAQLESFPLRVEQGRIWVYPSVRK